MFYYSLPLPKMIDVLDFRIFFFGQTLFYYKALVASHSSTDELYGAN